MNQENVFQENVKRWALFAPAEAEQVENLTCTSVFFKKNSSGEINLEKKIDESVLYYHSTSNIAEEAEEWFSKMDLQQIKVLYVFGVGLGYYYNAAKKWLQNEEHFLVFLENDLEVIHRLFETELGTLLLRDKQVRLKYFDTFDPMGDVWGSLCETFVRREFTFSALALYEKQFPDVAAGIRGALSFWSNICNMSYLEHATFGKHFYSNFYQNILMLPHANRASELFGKFAGIPAIICGAGPSLGKNLHLVESLSDRALVFAGASALNAVNSNGFVPHFGLGIDPNPSQLTRLIMNTAYEVPFLYRQRLYHEALRLIHGANLYVTGSGGYKISEWLENKLSIAGEHVSEGFNVVNFSLSLATAFGCNPIIFVGLDLAYTEGQSYHSGVTSHPTHSRKADFITKTGSEELIVKPDIFGNPVHTLWKWISESLWIGQFVDSHPNVLFINASEGGIGMPGVPNKPLSEVIDYLLPRRFDLRLRVHGEIQNSPMPESVNEEEIKKQIGEMAQNLEKCEQLCITLEEEFFNLSKSIKDGGEIPDKVMTTEMQKSFDALTQEEAYIYILKDFDDAYQPASSLSEQQIAYDFFITPRESAAKKALLQSARFKYLKNTALMNQALIQYYVFQKHPQIQSEVPLYQNPELHAEGENYSLVDDILTIVDPELELHVHSTIPKNKPRYVDRHFYPEKQLATEQHYLDGIPHGPSTFFGKDGKVLAQNWYVNGLKEGKSWFYYSSGALYSLQRFKNGLWNGLQQYYYKDGRPKTILNYSKGVLDGLVKLFYPTGKIKRELNFVHGQRHGTERMWSELGILLLEAHYDNGKPIHDAKSWYPNGQLALLVHFNADSIASSVECWNSDGIPVQDSGLLKDDYFDSIAKQTQVLTESLESVLQRLGDIAPLLFPSAPEFQDALRNDLTSLKGEIERLETMHLELLKESGVKSDGTKEPIWKTPSNRRELQAQMEKITKDLVKEISHIQDVVSLASKKLKEKIVHDQSDEKK